MTRRTNGRRRDFRVSVASGSPLVLLCAPFSQIMILDLPPLVNTRPVFFELHIFVSQGDGENRRGWIDRKIFLHFNVCVIVIITHMS